MGDAAADLRSRAESAYADGDFEGAVEAWEELHALMIERGDPRLAAEAAAMVAMYLMMDTGLMAPVRGWLRRADRLLAGVDDHPAHAVVAMVRTYERFMCGDMAAARVDSTRAIELGERLGVVPAVVIGRTCAARLTIFEGRVDEGLALLDEVGALLMSGGADPLTTGMMYCEIICAAQGLLLHDLAAEWTDVMERWRHGSAVGGIHGRCRVHRAEILRVTGTCEDAEQEALAACEELRPWMRREFGWPLVELGNIRLRAGDLEGAEEAFLAAHEHAWSPQPGLALIRLARGEVEEAATMLADAVERPDQIPSKERPPFGPLRLAPLLDAQAEVAFAGIDRPTLERTAAELRAVADAYRGPMLGSAALLAEARLALLSGEPEEAATASAQAVAALAEVGAPYETAKARLVLARAHADAGRPDAARLERQSARSTFVDYGAVLWAERVDHVLVDDVPAPGGHDPRTPPATATFSRQGDQRTVAWGDRSITLRDLKGLRHVERLLERPGVEQHAFDMMAIEERTGADAPVRSPGILVLDDAAKAAYKRRLADIEDDLADARACNDPARAELAERDREYLVAELRRAVGLGGRDRTVSDAGERARGSVTRSIRYALDRLSEYHPELAGHLRQHVRTGLYCSYEPDPLHPITWRL